MVSDKSLILFKKYVGAFLILALTCFSTKATASDNAWNVYTEFGSLTYSENFTIYGLLDGIDDSIFTPDGEASFTHNQWIAGVRKGAWDFGILTRYDYIAEYTKDAALIAFANETESEIPNGFYDIDVRLNHSRSYGLRLGYTHDLTEDFSIKLQLSGLAATEIIDGNLTGNIGFSEDEVDVGALAVDYHFTEDLLFLRDVKEPTGYGGALDVILNWQLNNKLKFEFKALDAISRIWWKDLTGTVADATSAVSRTDNNGVLIVRPALQGRNLLESYQQNLRTRLNLKTQFAFSDRWHVSQDVFKTGNNYLTQTEFGHQLNDIAYLGVNYEWVSGAIGANVNWRGLELGFATDSTKWREARYAKIHIGISKNF